MQAQIAVSGLERLKRDATIHHVPAETCALLLLPTLRAGGRRGQGKSACEEKAEDHDGKLSHHERSLR